MIHIYDLLAAKAIIRGSPKCPDLKGYAVFLPSEKGTTVSVSVYGLPDDRTECGGGIFAMHIHEGEHCRGNLKDPFAYAGSHYDTYDCMHPYHAGDMPSLFAAGGEAHLAFVTDRFAPVEIIGRTIVIHGSADDMHTQPSGASGERIGCGEITAMML